MAAELADRLVDAGSACVSELLLAETPRDHCDRRHARLPRSLDVPGRVTDHHRLARAALLQRGADKIGLRLRRLDLVVRRPPISKLAGVEEVEVVVDLLLRRRTGEHRRKTALLQLGD